MPDDAPAGLRILVCGGRGYQDKETVWRTLDRLHAERGIAAIIHGAATGADLLAAEWAWERGKTAGVLACSYPADWQKYGRAAGPIRNTEMLLKSRPDGVVAFPGGPGTRDCIRRAEAAGLKVWRVGW
jgi:predicted Rossmann-fold nucleotide-binding protein